MFLCVVRAAVGKGVTHEYVRVVEAFRQKGKTRHRTVLNLGRKDLLAAHLDLNKLMRLLHGEAVPDGGIREEDVCAVAAWDWGPMLVAAKCSIISKAQPAPGSNVRSASRRARKRHRPRRWCRKLSTRSPACGCSWFTPKSGLAYER